MCLIMSLFPATFFMVVGFFILFISTKAEGGVKILGLVLAIWFFIIAALFPIGGTIMTLSGNCPMTKMMQNMEFPILKEQ